MGAQNVMLADGSGVTNRLSCVVHQCCDRGHVEKVGSLRGRSAMLEKG